MGLIEIKCVCGSLRTSHVRTIETGDAIYEHVFVCKDCETTVVFRMTQILCAKSDPSLLV